jgi:hypothetical protein
MKNIWRKFVVVLLTLLIVAGSVTLVTGCKKEEGATTPTKESAEEPEEKEAEETEREAEDLDF